MWRKSVNLTLTAPSQDQSSSPEDQSSSPAITHESWMYVFPLDVLNRLLSSGRQITPDDIYRAAPFAIMMSEVEGGRGLITEKATLWPNEPDRENLRYQVIQKNGPSSHAYRSGLEETSGAGRQRVLEPWATLDREATLFVQERIRLSPELEAAVRANGNRIERFPLEDVPLSKAGSNDLFLLAVKDGEERRFIPLDQSTPVINFLSESALNDLKTVGQLGALVNGTLRRKDHLLQVRGITQPEFEPDVLKIGT